MFSSQFILVIHFETSHTTPIGRDASRRPRLGRKAGRGVEKTRRAFIVTPHHNNSTNEHLFGSAGSFFSFFLFVVGEPTPWSLNPE